jgi:hypothetical protein
MMVLYRSEIAHWWWPNPKIPVLIFCAPLERAYNCDFWSPSCLCSNWQIHPFFGFKNVTKLKVVLEIKVDILQKMRLCLRIDCKIMKNGSLTWFRPMVKHLRWFGMEWPYWVVISSSKDIEKSWSNQPQRN